MTNYFDDDSFWDEQAGEATSQITRVNRQVSDRTRTHHVVQRDALPQPLQHDDDEDAVWFEPVARDERLGAFGKIDPRLLSVGAIALAAMLVVPLVGALGNDDGDNGAFRSVAEAQTTTSTAVATTIPVEIVITAAVNPVESDSAESDSSSSSSADSSSSAESASSASSGQSAPAALRAADGCANTYEIVAGDYWVSIADAAGVTLDDLLAANEASAETMLFPGSDMCLPGGASVTSASGEGGSTGGEVAAADEPDTCTNVYEPVQGDYWLRIADASGVSLEELLAANNATADTAIYPGTDICLPAGATTPTPATDTPATAAPTTQPPATPAPTTDPPSTQPASTAPRNTTPPPSGGEVEQMIRDVWPDELEEDALRIAWRESNYRPDVTSSTGCCVGVFQLHWEAHRSWLAGIGVTSRDQLFDARTNIEAAYVLYQRSGGWGPWAL